MNSTGNWFDVTAISYDFHSKFTLQVWKQLITSDRNSCVKAQLNITTEGEHTVHAHVLLAVRGGPWHLPPVAFDYPNGFLVTSSLLIYRIIHQTLLRGDVVRQATAPSSWPQKSTIFALLSCTNTQKRTSIQQAYWRPKKANMNAIWQTRTGLLDPLPFWKQTATDTACCARSEITQSLSACSNTDAQTHRELQMTYADVYSRQPRQI